jgi:NAD(P)-dependent dehydrogenase (short-subunit alcohol dehydrogenase family)
VTAPILAWALFAAAPRRAAELGSGHVDILVSNAGVFPFGSTPAASDEASFVDGAVLDGTAVAARPSGWGAAA